MPSTEVPADDDTYAKALGDNNVARIGVVFRTSIHFIFEAIIHLECFLSLHPCFFLRKPFVDT